VLVELLDVLRDEDFDELLKLEKDGPRARQSALTALCRAVRRLQRPRAYVADLEGVPEDEEVRPSPMRVVWHEGRDLLIAQLQEREIRVIDPGTIRQIGRLCEPLADCADDWQEPLARIFLKDGCIEELWLPRHEVQPKRHSSLAKFAAEVGAMVHSWAAVREFVAVGKP
jgi:hypothetical protein